MDESYFQNIKRCFESLKFEKKRNRSKSCRSLNTGSLLPFLLALGGVPRPELWGDRALQKSRDARQELAQQTALHPHLWVQVHVEIFIWNWIWSSSWTEGGKHSSVCLHLLTCLPGTPEKASLSAVIKDYLETAATGGASSKTANTVISQKKEDLGLVNSLISLYPLTRAVGESIPAAGTSVL